MAIDILSKKRGQYNFIRMLIKPIPQTIKDLQVKRKDLSERQTVHWFNKTKIIDRNI